MTARLDPAFGRIARGLPFLTPPAVLHAMTKRERIATFTALAESLGSLGVMRFVDPDDAERDLSLDAVTVTYDHDDEPLVEVVLRSWPREG